MSDEQNVEPIAVVGLAVRVPGAADAGQFWENLRGGVESVTWFTREQQLANGARAADLDHPAWVPAAPVLEQVDGFDAALFGMTPREAVLADPQHRLFLETAHTALEDAGCDPGQFPGQVGVYAGTGHARYEWLHLRTNSALWAGDAGQLSVTTVNSPDYVATQLSYRLDLRGPALTVHTACSTSLVAVHLACEALRSGECDAAVAGGVSVELPHGIGYLGTEGYVSPAGHCRPFDADADGTIWGSGAGTVVLKRLSDALSDGDRVRAVIRGDAVNNDGADKVGFSAPSVSGQAAVIAQAVALAGIDPRTVTYVEAHGTGTALGDPIEVAALSSVYDAYSADRQWCALSAVKSNIGHLSQAAGVVGMVKAVLALEHGVVPPSLHYEKPNPEIDFARSPFYVAAAPMPFVATGGPRRAAVSSFGVGGTNAHVVLEQAPTPPPPVRARATLPAGAAYAADAAETTGTADAADAVEAADAPEATHAADAAPPELLRVSAHTASALATATTALADHLAQQPAQPLPDVAHTLRTGRVPRTHRTAVVARDAAGAAVALRDDRSRATGRADQPPRVVWLFSGQGAQYARMGAGLYRSEPVFAAAVDECLAVLGDDLRRVLSDPEGDEALAETRYTQPALFTVEYALARLWESWGLRPAAMIGHSVGEFVAATLAGVFAVPDALRLVATRGALMQEQPPGAMLAVQRDEAEVAPLLPDGLAVATVNGPGTCVVAGPVAEVEEFAAQLRAERVGTRTLRTSHAFHSPMMQPVRDRFAAAVAEVPRQAPALPFWSNATGAPVTAAEATDPEYWADHLRLPVRFGDCVAGVLREQGPWCFLECGPGRQLAGLVRMQLSRGDPAPLASMPTPEDEADGLYAAAAQLWTRGVPVDPHRPDTAPRRVGLPTYPYERTRYWSDPDPSAPAASTGARDAMEPARGTEPARGAETARAEDEAPLPPSQRYAVPVWHQLPPAPREPVTGECVVVTAGPRGQALAQHLAAAGAAVTTRPAGEPPAIPPDPGADSRAASDGSGADSQAPVWVVHAGALDGEPVADPIAGWGAQEQGFFSALSWVHAAAAAATPVHLDLVTGDTEDPVPGTLTRPEHATLAGVARVAPLEVTGLTVRWVDTSGQAPVDALVAELSCPPDEAPEVVLRAGRRFRREVAPVSLPAAVDGAAADGAVVEGAAADGGAVLRPGGRYLVTGGLGGVGLTLAEDLAARTRGELVLVSRSGLPPRETWDAHLAAHDPAGDRTARAIAAVRRMEAAGATVVPVAADITDPAALQELRAGFSGYDAALSGIVHAAGVAGGGAAEVRARADTEAVLAPKLRGTWALQAAFGDLPLDFVVLCSSVTALTGGFGQLDYCAANAFLDAYARADHGWRAPVLSVDWGGWAEVGMAAETDAPEALRAQAPAARLDHPVLTRRDGALLHGRVDPVRDWLLSEHRVAGTPVVPGTGHLECLRAAATAVLPAPRDGEVLVLRDVSFTAPLSVAPHATARYEVTVDGVGACTVTSSTTDGRRRHVHGTAAWEPAPPAAGDLAAAWARGTPTDPAGGRRGSVVSFGPRWDCLREVRVGDGEEVAALSLPPAATADADQWYLHPALLDVATSFGFRDADGAYLPMGYGEVVVRHPLAAQCYSHLRYQPAAADDVRAADITVYDADGAVLVEIRDFLLRRVDPTTLDPSLSGSASGAEAGDGVAEDVPATAAIQPEEGARALRALLAAGVGPQVVVSALPLTALYRRARAVTMPVPAASGPGHADTSAAEVAHDDTVDSAGDGYVAPRTSLEQQLAEVWQQVLGVPYVGAEDDFFALGGNSLVAVQLIAQVRSAVQVKLPMRTLFDHPTVAGMAARVAELRGGATDDGGGQIPRLRRGPESAN